jgi:Outer membrane protein beta-barrel domain
MSEHIHDIDDFFKKPIEAHSEMPSAAVWEAIENNFDKNNHVQLKKKYQTLKKIAAVLLLLLCGSIFFLVIKNDKKEIANIEKVNTEKTNVSKVGAENNLSPTSNSTTEKTNNLQNINSTATLKNNKAENTIAQQNIDLQKGKISNAFKNNASISKQNTFQQNKKVKRNTIYSNEEISNKDEDIFYTKNTKSTSKNKTNISVRNGNATEEELSKNENNSTDNILQPTLFLPEKILVAQNIFNPTIYLPAPISVFKPLAAEDIANKTKKAHAISATIYASPEFTFNRLEDDKPHQDRTQPPPNGARPRDDRDKIKREENKTTSFSAGILIDYAINKRISLQSGIAYTSKTTEEIPKKVFAEKNTNGEVKYKSNCALGATYINPKTGVVTNVGDSTTLGNTKNVVQYISVPLNVSYHFKVGKFNISPTVGVAANILVKQRATTNVEGDATQNITTIEGVNNNYFNANFGVGLDYSVSKKISLSMMPNVRIGLNPLNKNSNVKFYSNTAGLMIGLKYNF